MKKFETLGRTLTKDQQKKIMGGRLAAQTGWNLNGSNCTCDYQYIYPDGTIVNYCSIPCLTICCSESNSCALLLD